MSKATCSQRIQNHHANDIYTEVDRAVDNLVKSGKMFGGMAGRRDSMPMTGGAARTFPDQFGTFDPWDISIFKRLIGQ